MTTLDGLRPPVARVRVGAAVVLAAAVLVPTALHLGPGPAADSLLLLVEVIATAVLAHAARTADHDRDTWRWWAVATGAVAGGELLGLLSHLVPGVTSNVSDLLLPSLGALVGTPLLYQGIVRWNRFRTYVSDPGDWLNGVSCVLVITAAGMLVVRWTESDLASWDPWRLQTWLLGIGALVGILGTVLTVGVLGGLRRDPRFWLVAGAVAGMLATTVAAGGLGEEGLLLAHAGWAGSGALTALAGTMRRRADPVPATSQAPAVGAVIVLGVSVVVLAVDGHGPRREVLGLLPTVYAVLAFAVIGVRVWYLVRELAQLAESRQQALTDELTGTANRRSLLRALERTSRGGAGAALLVADLDGFKDVNDRYGHHAGDDLLRHMAQAMASALPSAALLARTGGDEFAVLLPLVDGDAAERIAQDVRTAVVDAVAGVNTVDQRRLATGISIGVTATSGRFETDVLLRQADTAMYIAKAAGAGVSVFDSEVDARVRDRAEVAADLLALVTAGAERMASEIVVHYQPQLDVATGAVVGVEALVRWQHPTRGLLPPLVFLGLAEEQGLMDDLTVHVLWRAAYDTRDWTHARGPLRVSVNLSATSLAHPDLLTFVDDLLRCTGLEPGRLVLEVTETTLMDDPDLALAVTHELTRRGVELSIDDYGTGYSSLAYLTDLPATELKLDRAFTVRVLDEPRTAEIVEATVALAHRLGLRVVAEGVEDAPTLDVLDRLGVDESQGYLHSRPLPPAEFASWLAGVPGGHALDVVVGEEA